MRGVPRERRASSMGPGGLGLDPEEPRRARDDLGEVGDVVVVEPFDDPEAVAERRGQEPGPSRGPDQREGLQVELDGARRRALADHDVELEFLQRGIEDLLDHRAQAVDLVDEQDAAALQVGEDRGEIGGALQDRSGGLAQARPHLVGDDVGECGLAEPRGTEEEHVVERLVTLAGRADEDLELVPHRPLADVLREPARAQALLGAGILRRRLRQDDAVELGHELGVSREWRSGGLRGQCNASRRARPPIAPASIRVSMPIGCFWPRGPGSSHRRLSFVLRNKLPRSVP